MGLGLYGGLTFQRARNKDLFKDCETCSFIRSPTCPGFRPFHPELIEENIPVINSVNN